MKHYQLELRKTLHFESVNKLSDYFITFKAKHIYTEYTYLLTYCMEQSPS
jgi:hypothetical protein